MRLSTFIPMAFVACLTSAIDLDVDDKDSICAAAKLIQQGEWNYYEGNRYGGTLGMFTYPYYWWHAGEAFGGLLDYYVFCDSDNSTLESLIYEGMYHQRGADDNYIPSNQSMTEGNDDQGVWGLATMEAVERNFTNPDDVSWLELTQAVFNTMNARWDSDNCGGGLRWQIFTWNSGYDYKNSISNGCLFTLAARLARYTGNETYVEVAERVWKWMAEDSHFFVESGDAFQIYDGAKIPDNCSDVTKTRWSYTYGIFISGCAYLYNFTYENDTDAADEWLHRANEVWAGSKYFFNSDDIMTETSCEPSRCNNDQKSFRSLFSRGLHQTMALIPSMYDEIMPYIRKSAAAAAQSCSGGSDGVTCGVVWNGTWDGNYGLGQQMSALECVQALLVRDVLPPLTSTTGGSSKSNPNAGLDSSTITNSKQLDITGKDKAGAGVLTAVVLAIVAGGGIWMIL